MVTAIALIAFFTGVAAGIALYPLFLRERKSTESKPGFSLRDLMRPAPKPQPKKMPSAALPRNIGSWRKQKADLEREHNSKQKLRDQRFAGL